jgi:signal transduction histidine kinase
MVQKFATESRGRVTVTDAEGGGAVFLIELPARAAGPPCGA